MSRVEGYYWCKTGGSWYIFTWDGAWYDGPENVYNETDLEEIDERRITMK